MRATVLGAGMALLLAVTAAQPALCQRQNRQEEFPIDRWNRMSPEQREKELAKLPPERARLIRQRLRRYNQMNPQEQQALRERYRTFSEMPPAKQEIIRSRLKEFRQLPVERRPIVHHEVEGLRAMPDAQREGRLNSDEFRGRYSQQEQQIIRDLTEYLPDNGGPRTSPN
ncbi:MAG TPA: DUF3106 domain-containing protein [Bryobacteraceae bacterium]|nr:DUF3106 domain-containing protein [Bryobacteraceae bacterium]